MKTPKILAATYNPISDSRLLTVMIDVPFTLLPELLKHKELSISYRDVEDIKLEEVLDAPYVPVWIKQQKSMSDEILNQMWLEFLKGCDSKMSIDVNSNTTINQVCFDTNSPESSGWIVDYKKLGILDMYNYLLEQQVHKQNANRLLAPFAYTTCIITGTEWNEFFEEFCPKYEPPLNNVYYSVRQYIKNIPYCNNDAYTKKDFWQSINKSKAKPELQEIAEKLYDLYQEADWKESKYHIPFEEDIVKLYKNDLFTLNNSGYDNESYCKDLMKISASMCTKFSYDTQDTLEEHLNATKDFQHQAKAMNKQEYEAFSVSVPFIEKNNTKYNGRHITAGDDKLDQGVYLGRCGNLHGFISEKYILENL